MEVKNNFLYVLKEIEKITGESPCKKKLQKLIYLIENSAGKLNYEYAMHFYGPYSSQLNEEMHVLLYEDVIKIEHKGLSHCLSVKNDENYDLIDQSKKDKIDALLGKFAKLSPNELERITTTLYVMQNLCKTEEDIIQMVLDIKGSKYNIEDIKKDIQHIKSESLLILES